MAGVTQERMRCCRVRLALWSTLCAAVAVLCSLVSLAGAASPPPNEPSLRVVVDPRVELMSLVFRLAGNPEYRQGRLKAYCADVENRFGSLRDHRAVKIARELRATRGVSFDAVMSMAVHIDNLESLQLRIPLKPWPDGLDTRWAADRVPEFLNAVRDFAKEADFQGFVGKQQTLYEVTTSRMSQVLQKDGHLEWFAEFFGARPSASFTVALGMLNGGQCYGPHCRLEGHEELYCILGVWRTDAEGKPQFDRSMLDTVIHEFCHSYTNALVDRHASELQRAGEQIFPHVADTMQSQAYGNWRTMLYESLVRACVLRYTRRYDGRIAAWQATQEQTQRGFLWISGLSDLLGEYETQRDKYAKLDDFSPRIVQYFDSYAEQFVKEQKALDAKRPKIVSMLPANGARDVDPETRKIEVVFDRTMRDGAWSLVGGGPNFPEVAGQPSYDAPHTTWSVPVKLKPDWTYEFMLNSSRFTAFRSAEGIPLTPVKVKFTTGKKATDRRETPK